MLYSIKKYFKNIQEVPEAQAGRYCYGYRYSYATKW